MKPETEEETLTEPKEDSKSDDEISKKPKKKRKSKKKDIENKRKGKRSRKKQKKLSKPRTMTVNRNLLRNNIIVNKKDETLLYAIKFFSNANYKIEELPNIIKKYMISSLEMQKHHNYLNTLPAYKRILINKYLNNIKFNEEVNSYLAKNKYNVSTVNSNYNNLSLIEQISVINNVIINAPILSKNITIFRDILVSTKIKNNHIYTESGISLSRFNPVPKKNTKDTHTIRLTISKGHRCVIKVTDNIYDDGEIFLPIGSKFKITGSKTLHLKDKQKHIMYIGKII